MVCMVRKATQKHHLMSRTKWALKKYGAKLLDHPLNLLDICEPCHLWKPIPKYTEQEFIENVVNKAEGL